MAQRQTGETSHAADGLGKPGWYRALSEQPPAPYTQPPAPNTQSPSSVLLCETLKALIIPKHSYKASTLFFSTHRWPKVRGMPAPLLATALLHLPTGRGGTSRGSPPCLRPTSELLQFPTHQTQADGCPSEHRCLVSEQ